MENFIFLCSGLSTSRSCRDQLIHFVRRESTGASTWILTVEQNLNTLIAIFCKNVLELLTVKIRQALLLSIFT